MSKNKSIAVRPAFSAGELWTARFCLILAFGISLFLLWNSLRGGAVPGCGPDSDCDKVLTSRWAWIFGVPVSGFALPVYALLLALLFQKSLRWALLLPLGMVVLLSALWFVGLQAFAIKAFCKFCMTAHAAGAFAALLLLKANPLPGRATLLRGTAALAAVAVIAALQFASPAPAPKALRSQHSEGMVRAGEPAASHTITIVDGQFRLHMDKLPLTGPIDAPKKMVKLFDYSCHHCRDLHHLLEAFRTKHSNELAIVSLPVPLNPDCNPLVKRRMADHVNACEYARLGLAVYLAKPARFSEFTDWVFAPPRPPSVAETRAYAEKLVGAKALNDALNSPAISEQIAMDVQIYATSSRIARSGAMPQLLFEGGGGSIGAISSAEQLEKLMAENLGIASTAPAKP